MSEKISIVIPGRNDGFDESDIHCEKYLLYCIKYLEEKKKRYDFDYEFIFIEYNYLPNKPLISEKLIKLTNKIKCYLVNNNLHTKIFKNSYPFLEMQARRIGNLKATGDWILFKSLESVWFTNKESGDEFDWFDDFFNNRDLLKEHFMWMPHKVIDREKFMKDGMIEVIRKEEGWMNGGDFYLAHKDLMNKVKGYPSPIKLNIDGQPRQEIAIDAMKSLYDLKLQELKGYNYHIGKRTQGNNLNKYLSDVEMWNKQDIQDSKNNDDSIYNKIPCLTYSNNAIIDVGANEGKFIEKYRHRSELLICIEANPDLMNKLPDYSLNLQYAIGVKNIPDVNFYILGNDATSSLLLPNTKEIEDFYIDGITNQKASKDIWDVKKVIHIEQQDVATIIRRFNINNATLKLDTQGSDFQILKQIGDDIYEKIDEVICEVYVRKGTQTPYLEQDNFEDVVKDFMIKKGYILLGEESQTCGQEKNLFFRRGKDV